ncbi:arylesterase [Limibacillus sp. MBR-115]|jgi:acyl-CoA thioesterase-1
MNFSTHKFFPDRLFAALLLALTVLAMALPQAAAKPLRLMAYGDSLIHGYGLGPGETFPDQLQDALDEAGYDVTVINAGNSGETTAGGRARLDWSLAESPDAVLLLLGANDMLRGIDPAEAKANLSAIIEALQARDIEILLAGMRAQPGLGADYVDAFNALYPALAETYQVPLYPFFLEGVAAVPPLNQSDGLHPNADGVARIVEAILPSVTGLLDQLREAP